MTHMDNFCTSVPMDNLNLSKPIKTKKLAIGTSVFSTKKKVMFIKKSLHVACLLLFVCEIRIRNKDKPSLKKLLRTVFVKLNIVVRFDVIIIISLHFSIFLFRFF